MSKPYRGWVAAAVAATLLTSLHAPRVLAETVVVNDQVLVRQTEVPRPKQGMSMAQVQQHFGEPRERHPTVGTPPITRWDYDSFAVFFEKDLVIDAVVPGTPGSSGAPATAPVSAPATTPVSAPATPPVDAPAGTPASAPDTTPIPAAEPVAGAPALQVEATPPPAPAPAAAPAETPTASPLSAAPANVDAVAAAAAAAAAASATASESSSTPKVPDAPLSDVSLHH